MVARMRDLPLGGIVAALKSIAFTHRALKLTEDGLIDLLVKEFQIETPRNAIARALKSTTLQFQLADEDAFIWIGRDSLYRLVDRTECPSSAAAAARIEKHTGYCCKFCGMPEVKSNKPEIFPEIDHSGRRVKDSWVHPGCAVALKRLRDRCYE